jgi:hypothetical protein
MRVATVFGLIAVAIACAGLTHDSARAERLPIQLDGYFEDWTDPPVATDRAADGGSNGVDLGRLWLADDPNTLYLRFDTGAELQLNAGNDIVLYLDTDMNAQTGLPVGDIGAELEWHFGTRSGTCRFGAGETGIHHLPIRFLALPSVTSTDFEMGISRLARPDGTHALFPGSSIRVLLWDRTGGDRLPDDGEVVTYRFDQGALPPDVRIPLGKQKASDLRLTTNNTLDDGPWDATRGPKFRREYRALAPEILNFQEVYDHTPEQMAALLESWLPSQEGETWHATSNQDCHTVSRYPIERTWTIGGNLASLVDATPTIGSKLMIVNVHLYCCENDAGRQREVDQILAFLRDAKEPGGIEIPDGTPIVIVGDTNFVGSSQQLRSLLDGNIIDNETFGADFPPDWDGSGLRDLISRQTEKRVAVTWLGDSSDYWGGRLDFCIFSDSAIDVGNHFILNTAAMSPDTLAALGLQSGDNAAADHLPVVVDLRAGSYHDSSGVDLGTRPHLFVAPNPAISGVTLTAALPEPAQFRLEVIDVTGRVVAHPGGTGWIARGAGLWTIGWNERNDEGRRVAAGSYYVRLRVRGAMGETLHTEKLTVLR